MNGTLKEEADRCLGKALPDPADPYRLRLHATPPTGWMNDPNGFCRYKGEYHLFYQCSPFSPESGLKYWGHMTSPDLLEWTDQPVALAPDCGYDRDGCYSGGALEKDGTLWVMYTGHVCGEPGREMGRETEWAPDRETAQETQNLAFSRDGIHFEKYPGNPVIGPERDPDPDFRDPFVWEKDGRFYCLVGNRKGDHGRILMYESGDLIRWHFKSVLLEGGGDMGFMWECPGLLSFTEGDVLFLSVEGKAGKRHSTWYLSGSLDLESGVFSVNRTECLDWGESFYAPQVLACEGQSLLVGWMDRWFSYMPSRKWGWAGAMSIPRSLSLGRDGLLRMRPVEGIRQLPGQRFEQTDFAVEERESFALESWCGTVFLLELWISRSKSTCESFSLEVRKSGTGEMYAEVMTDLKGNRIIVDLTRADGKDCNGPAAEAARARGRVITAPFYEQQKDCLQVTVLSDCSSLEVFADQGRVAVTNRIYPDRASSGLGLRTTNGKLWVKKLRFWKMI